MAYALKAFMNGHLPGGQYWGLFTTSGMGSFSGEERSPTGLSLTGVYIGLKLRFRQDSRLRPFFLGNFGIVRLSSLDVVVNGSEIPYWDSAYRDYLDLGAGIEYDLTDNVVFFLDARLELFGKPDSANPPISEATGASAFPVTFGIDYKFQNH